MLASTPTQILMSPTNNSTAKAQFSFPKASRFPKTKVADSQFYSIPSSFSDRSTTFGFGKKSDFTKEKEKTPDPGVYVVTTDITRTGKAYSFGISRDASKRYIKGHFAADPSTPGPGAYAFSPKFGREGRNITIGGKTSIAKVLSLSPGPGAYDQKFKTNNGNYILSNHKNLQVHSFSSSNILKNPISLTPAPGHYNVDKGFLKNSEVLSTVRSNGSRKFALSPRATLELKSESPGPGAYRLPSEFGYYESPKALKN